MYVCEIYMKLGNQKKTESELEFRLLRFCVRVKSAKNITLSRELAIILNYMASVHMSDNMRHLNSGIWGYNNYFNNNENSYTCYI